MIIIRFKDAETERRAIGYLAGRFPGKSYADGDTLAWISTGEIALTAEAGLDPAGATLFRPA